MIERQSDRRYLGVQVMWSILPFMQKNAPNRSHGRVRKWMQEFRSVEGANLKIGAIGFCWGGYHVTKLARGDPTSNGRPVVDVAYTAHPSELKLPEDIEQIAIPYSVVIGDVDFAMPLKQVEEMRQILSKAGKPESEVVVISNAKHGFAVRADPEDEQAMVMAHQAFHQAINWFKEHLDSN
ncbi:hypothetical protein LTR84_000190 [Exophiala bonariae]|uniref:Dienelactone hydrolase domain-containing protein n=1 Tax=Exophiala bonariae TaxID=1690606 RepID=A0AAV9NTE3_9EURO|nr:hypothetical protein LTR84_000190 [Exophiala bonariae]